MNNRYFIIEKTNPNYAEIIDCVVGKKETQRESLDKIKVVIKLPLGDEENHTCLEGVTEYSHEEILPIMASVEWQEEDIF